MKKTLLSAVILLLLFCAKINAQTTITTWYIIPPTSGCNGVWAVDLSQATCGVTYNYSPVMCAQWGGTTVADTLFIPLCSMPCTLTAVDINGNVCGTCSTGTMTGIETSSAGIFTTYPNPATTQAGWNIMLRQPGENVTVNIYNTLGELVLSENHSQADQIVHVDISSLTAGTYVAEISVNDAVAYNQQLMITK